MIVLQILDGQKEADHRVDHLKNLPGLAPLTGGMKFAAQISPLLNYSNSRRLF